MFSQTIVIEDNNIILVNFNYAAVCSKSKQCDEQ